MIDGHLDLIVERWWDFDLTANDVDEFGIDIVAPTMWDSLFETVEQ